MITFFKIVTYCHKATILMEIQPKPSQEKALAKAVGYFTKRHARFGVALAMPEIIVCPIG